MVGTHCGYEDGFLENGRGNSAYGTKGNARRTFQGLCSRVPEHITITIVFSLALAYCLVLNIENLVFKYSFGCSILIFHCCFILLHLLGYVLKVSSKL